VTSRENGLLATRGVGDYFGEASLRTGAPTIASVTAVGACKLVRMDRGAFQRLLGPVESLLKMRTYNAAGREVELGAATGAAGSAELAAAKSADASALSAALEARKKRPPLALADLSVSKKVIGEGAFGKVRRAHLRSAGERAPLYAIKEMDKNEIIASGQVEHILQVRARGRARAAARLAPCARSPPLARPPPPAPLAIRLPSVLEFLY
jgi:CRP-like cAMP-binding protein